jgi:hypothetical protein
VGGETMVKLRMAKSEEFSTFLVISQSHNVITGVRGQLGKRLFVSTGKKMGTKLCRERTVPALPSQPFENNDS